MYQPGGSNQVYSDTLRDVELVDVELVDVEIAQDPRLRTTDPEDFDLYEWAIEFSKAVGFETEHAAVACKD